MKKRSLCYMSLFLMLEIWMPAQHSAAQAQFHRSQSSHHKIQLHNTPLIEALALIEELSGRPILLNQAAIKQANVDLRSPITIVANKRSYDKVIDQILPNSLRRINKDRSIIITTINPADKRSNRRDSYTSAREMAMQASMNQVFPIHFDQMPLSMALEFVAGFAGVDIVMHLSEREKFENLVTIHEDHAKLSTCLKAIVSKSGMNYEIRDKKIVVFKSESDKRRFL